MNPATNKTIERINSHAGGIPKPILPIMVIGDVNGMIESQNARSPSGFCKTAVRPIIDAINGIVIGNINC